MERKPVEQIFLPHELEDISEKERALMNLLFDFETFLNPVISQFREVQSSLREKVTEYVHWRQNDIKNIVE